MKSYLVHVQCGEYIEVEAETEAQAEACAVETMESGFNDWKADIVRTKDLEEE